MSPNKRKSIRGRTAPSSKITPVPAIDRCPPEDLRRIEEAFRFGETFREADSLFGDLGELARFANDAIRQLWDVANDPLSRCQIEYLLTPEAIDIEISCIRECRR